MIRGSCQTLSKQFFVSSNIFTVTPTIFSCIFYSIHSMASFPNLCRRYGVFKKKLKIFLTPKKWKNGPQKLLIIGPDPFISQSSPDQRPTAQNWFFILWNLGTRHLFSYLWFKRRLEANCITLRLPRLFDFLNQALKVYGPDQGLIQWPSDLQSIALPLDNKSESNQQKFGRLSEIWKQQIETTILLCQAKQTQFQNGLM